MNIYKVMNEAIQSKNLLYSGKKLIEFANTAYVENNRATLVKHFFEYLNQYALINYAFDIDEKRYYICPGQYSTSMYIAFNLPKDKTPVRALNEIRLLGEYILDYFDKPVGEIISRASLSNILQFLDGKYNFSSRVFKKRRAAFILLPYSHKEYNSQCLFAGADKDIVLHFFLYHMKNKDKATLNPEAVLFHELGHAIYAHHTKNIHEVPKDMLDLLESTCFPKIKELSSDNQCEIFADVLSMGLMYNTPFEKYDLFKQVHPKDKELFKKIVENLLEVL